MAMGCDHKSPTKLPPRISLGLCCINNRFNAFKNPKDPRRRYTNRKMTQAKALEDIQQHKGQGLVTLIHHNLRDLEFLVRWNHANGIRVFRLSSNIFSHHSNPHVHPNYPDMAQFGDQLRRIGHLARQYGQRLTMHPGQYNVLGTPSHNTEALSKTILDLKCHAQVLETIHEGRPVQETHSVMVIHGGGTYGDKQATLRRFCENYRTLPDVVRKYLVLENCEKNFHIEDCLWVSEQVGIPVVFDLFHHTCYIKAHPHQDPPLEAHARYLDRVVDTWARRGIKPKFHLSDQGTGRLGHHAPLVKRIPKCLFRLSRRQPVDIMIEAKAKEDALEHLLLKYRAKLSPLKFQRYFGRPGVPSPGTDEHIFDRTGTTKK